MEAPLASPGSDCADCVEYRLVRRRSSTGTTRNHYRSPCGRNSSWRSAVREGVHDDFAGARWS